MRKQIDFKFARKRFLPIVVGAALLGIAFGSAAATPPANDNIANAQLLLGLTGSVTGNNQAATAQTGEPPSYYNLSGPAVVNPAGATIWYYWTAPVTEIVNFDTRNSTLPDGTTMDTVMSVYAASGSPATLAGLSLLTNNDDDPNAASWPLTSRVSFPATIGTTYYFQLDGSQKLYGTNEQGYIVLNWGPSLAGGQLGFVTNVIQFGQLDDELDVDDSGGSIFPSLSGPDEYQGSGIYAAAHPTLGGAPVSTANIAADEENSIGDVPEGRVTVTRTGAYNGRIEVDMMMTNDFYENTYTTNIWITNFEYDEIIYNTNTNSAGFNMPSGTNLGVTNIWFTNIDIDFNLEYDTNGTLDTYDILYYRQNIWTNVPNAMAPAMVNSYGGVTNCGVSNKVVDNNATFNPSGMVTNMGAFSTNIASIYVLTTNVSYTNPPAYTFLTPSAIPGVDYSTNDNQTLTFDDYQMSQDAYVQIGSSSTSGGAGGPDWPDALGNNIVGGINRRVILTLANPRLDPLESQDVSPPTLAPNYLATSGFLPIVSTSQTDMNILDVYNPPTPTPCTNSTVYNLERRTFRTDKDWTTSVTLYVIREGSTTATGMVTYSLDMIGIDSPVNDWQLEAGSDYAYELQGTNTAAGGNWDFAVPTSGTITFPPKATYEPLTIPINNNGAVEFNMDFIVTLTGASGDASSKVGDISTANVTMLYDDLPGGQQPGGAVDRSWNADDQPGSTPPYNALPGANLEVDAAVVQPNGSAVIAGQFDSFDSQNLYHVARTLPNGSPDPAFNPGSGANDSVLAVAVDSSSRIIVGGNFTAFNNLPGTYHLARLTTAGTVDGSFNNGVGPNGPVRSITLDAAGNIIIAGDFTAVNNISVSNVARLLPSGAVDASFNPGPMDPAGTVYAVAVDGLGNVVIGGSFSTVNGTNWPGLARLTPSGALDTNFNPGTDVPSGTVYTLAIAKPGNQIVFGGSFSTYNLYQLNNIASANYNGSVNTNFNPGAGANDTVWSLAIQTNGNIVLGGQFTQFGSVRRLGLARLLPNGWMDTSFMDPSYNQFAGLINHYYNPAAVNPNDAPAENNTLNFIKTVALEPSGNIIVGGSFVRIGGGYTRDDVRLRWNVARVSGNPTPGPQTPGGDGLGNYPGTITFTTPSYSVDEDQGYLFVTVTRTNGSLGPINIIMATNNYPAGSGAANGNNYGLADNGFTEYTSGLEEEGEFYGWRVGDGLYGFNYDVLPIDTYVNSPNTLLVTIIDDKTQTQNLLAGLSLISVNSQDSFLLGGENTPTQPSAGLSSAQLQIINDNFPAGTLGFSITNFATVDNNGFVTISVFRTNGSTGNVSVQYKTANGFTNGPLGAQSAIAGSSFDYIATNNTLNFANGVTSNGFRVQINGFSTVQPTKFFNVELFNPGNGASLDTNIPPFYPSISTVSIYDDNFSPGHLSFGSTTFSGTKGSTSTIAVNRTAGGLGTLTVQVVSSDLTGSNGINYLAYSNTLTWGNSNVAPQYVTITNLEDNEVDGTRTMKLSLLNPTVVGNPTLNSQVLLAPTVATNFISDDDFYGSPTFVVNNFNVLQNGGSVLVTVVRIGGTIGTVTVNYATSNGTNAASPNQPALVGTNYGLTTGTLTFLPGVTSQSFTVPIFYTPTETNAANRIVNLTLSSPTPSAITNGYPKKATITILDNQLVTGAPGSVDTTIQTGIGFNGIIQSLSLQPDGKILAAGLFTFVNNYPFNNIARLDGNGAVDTGFLFGQAGTDATIRSVMSQSPAAGQTNGPVMIVGDFTNVDNVGRRGVARLNLDGTLDETFNPGAGADSAVLAIIEMSTNQFPSPTYVIGGNFANYNGVPMGGIARVLNTGQIDPNFNPGAGITGTNGAIHAIALQENGQIIVGGDFTSFNNLPHHHLVRLNLDGSADGTFNPDTGADNTGSVQAILVQPDGRIVIGGVFTNVNGVALNHLARLNQDGTLDSAFNVGLGANNTVLSLVLDSQQRILVAGQFTTASGVTRNGITRLNPDGTVDPTINFGAGANGYVTSLAISGNDEINVGGSFTSFGGIAQNNFTRLFGGAITGAGVLNFSQAVFGVLQSQSNAIVTIQRSGGTGSTNIPVVSALFSTADGSALAGLDYVAVTNIVNFPLGEPFASVTIPLLNTGAVGPDKTVNLNLSNPIAATLGGQPTAVLVISNVNAAVAFTASSYRQAENVPGGNAVIPVVRVGSLLGTLEVTAYTGTNGSAVPGRDYTPQNSLLIFPPGMVTNLFVVPLLNSANMLNDTTVDLELTNASNCFLVTPSEATLTIATVNAGPGTVSFAQTNYTVSEFASFAPITLLRTNGISGTVSVTLSTSPGTAVAGVNYSNITQVATFSDSQTSVTLNIPVISNSVPFPDTTVNLTLSNPVNTTISGSNATLTIQNDIENFTIGAPASSPDYFVSEGGGSLTFVVYRNGPTNGAVSVGYATSSPANASNANGFAVPGTNYVPTSGVLTFVPGQTFETIPVNILQNKTVDGPLTFELVLTNASSGTQIGNPGIADVTILGNVTGFALATNAYIVGENGGSVVVTVTRLNADTGNASVNYTTSDNTALGGVDYSPTSGVLAFVDGQASNTVTIPILDPGVVEANKTFNFALSSPVSATSSNAYLLSPSNAVVTITNVLSALSFTSSTYSVNETNFQIQISVIRTGLTNNTVSVNYGTSPGTAVNQKNYVDTNGTLTFNPGVTNLTFPVTVIDDHLIDGDHTVNLGLSSPSGAILQQPSTAILTILEGDGSYVAPDGVLLLSESDLPTNGIVDPGETVTVDFGMRCISGGSTTNLIAVMQTNANVTPVITATNGPTNSYGVLIQGGHGVSRPFTFTASGTNNQVISVYFQLYDGVRPLTNVVFNFTLGSSVTTFSNPGLITITNIGDASAQPTAAIPYPSTINVTGLSTIDKVTVTFSNLGHASPADIEAVLQSPAESTSPSQNILLMADVGGGASVTNLSVTFDDAAGTYMSPTQLLGSRSVTNKPTGYITVINGNVTTTSFIGNQSQWAYLPDMPAPVPLAPYSTNLSVVNGSVPNGVWSLYVADTALEDYGAIKGGWSLNLSTGNPVASAADLQLNVTAPAAQLTVSNAILYNIALTNYGPSVASGIVISNVIPPGFIYLSNSFPGVTAAGSSLTFSATNTLGISNGLAFSLYMLPTTNGAVTNTFVALASQIDPNTNNITNVVSQINTESADMGIAVSGFPNEVLGGQFVSYTITVSNAGPSGAVSTIASNTLPGGMLFYSYLASTGAVITSNGVSYWTIGNLAANSNATLTIVAQAAGTNPTTITNLDGAGVQSALYDPLKANNFQQAKTIIDPSPSVSITNNLSTFTLVWTGSATNFAVQGATNLSSPIVWTTLTNAVTVNGAGQFTITIPTNEVYHFFRLRTKLP